MRGFDAEDKGDRVHAVLRLEFWGQMRRGMGEEEPVRFTGAIGADDGREVRVPEVDALVTFI